MKFSITILAAFLTTTLACPTDITPRTPSTTPTDHNSTLSARYTREAWIGSYDNKGTTCQNPHQGPGPIRPEPDDNECTKFRRDTGQSMVINWGAEMGARNHLSTFYDDNCGSYAKNYEKDGRNILLCDDTVAGDRAWGSAKIWYT